MRVKAIGIAISMVVAMTGFSSGSANAEVEARPAAAPVAAPESSVTLRQAFTFEKGWLTRTGRAVRLSIPRNAEVSVVGRGGTKQSVRAEDVGRRHVSGGGGLAPRDVTVTLPGAGGNIRMLKPKVRVTSKALVISGTLPAKTRTRTMDNSSGWYVGADGKMYPSAGEVAMLMDVPMCSGTYVNTFVSCLGSSFSYVFSEYFPTTYNGDKVQARFIALSACMPYEYIEDQSAVTLTVTPPTSSQFSTSVDDECSDYEMTTEYDSAELSTKPNKATSTSGFTLFSATLAWEP